MKIDKELDEAARKYAKIKPSIDVNDEDERYYNSYNLAIYDAFVNGAMLALKNNNKVITEITALDNPEDMIKDKWYIVVAKYVFLLNFNKIDADIIYSNKHTMIENSWVYDTLKINAVCNIGTVKWIIEATREEVLKYFPTAFDIDKFTDEQL